MQRHAGRTVSCKAVRVSRASAHPMELLGAVVLAELRRGEDISACHHWSSNSSGLSWPGAAHQKSQPAGEAGAVLPTSPCAFVLGQSRLQCPEPRLRSRSSLWGCHLGHPSIPNVAYQACPGVWGTAAVPTISPTPCKTV